MKNILIISRNNNSKVIVKVKQLKDTTCSVEQKPAIVDQIFEIDKSWFMEENKERSQASDIKWDIWNHHKKVIDQ